MTRSLIFTIFLVLMTPSQGFSAGSGSSDSGSNSSYSMPFQVKSSKRTDKSFNEVCRIVPLGIQDHHQHMHQESNEVTSDDKYEGGMLLFQVSNQTSVIRLEGDVPL